MYKRPSLSRGGDFPRMDNVQHVRVMAFRFSVRSPSSLDSPEFLWVWLVIPVTVRRHGPVQVFEGWLS